MSDEFEIVGPPEESLTSLEPLRVGTPKVAPLARGMLLAGRYEIRNAIGRGGMGVVVCAYDRTLGEEVAIKIVRSEFAGDPFWSARLAREVKLARQIQHPNVCRVFDFESADGRVFLVMELATQRTLRSEIATGAIKTRSLPDRLEDARAVASGLGAIHAAGIVHRDLSPQNLLRMADGRLVLSDFGLATDSCENSTAVQGGTVAYMAPELVRGGRASLATDVWALGAVIHEAVFGRRPRWESASFEMLDPLLDRRLVPTERAVLEICRACTAADPARRPASAGEVAVRLQTCRRTWTATTGRWARRLLPATAVAVALVATAVVAHRVRPNAGEAKATPAIAIVPTGEARDWTTHSTTLVSADQGIACMTVLPDRRTVRFVSGQPRQAEDLDTETGLRRPSPILPITYVEGCPHLSPDGTRLLYPGHTPEGRAFAFVAERPDGSDAVPVVATAEPSQASEPTWLADGRSFSYDVDLRHMAVYSLVTNRSTVLAEPTTAPHASANRYAGGDRIFVSAWLDAASTEISGYEVPSLRERFRFHLSELLADWRPAGDTKVFYTTTNYLPPSTVLELDLERGQARRAGFVRDQLVDRLGIVRGGLLLLTSRLASNVTARWPDGKESLFRRGGPVFGGDRCGDTLMLAEQTARGIAVNRVDWLGRELAQATSGPFDLEVSCAPDGATWFYSSFAPSTLGLWRCAGTGCRRIVNEATWGPIVSPDSTRIAFVSVGERGPTVHWMPSTGGEPHDLAETETLCRPTWSSNNTLWIARRRGSAVIWTEIALDTGRVTGREHPGTTDCTDSRNDPETPDANVRVSVDRRSQIRLVRDP